MHGPKTVSGEWGIGKIEIKFKPKPPKKFPLGFTLFVFGSLLLIMQGMWRNAWLRSEVMIPVGAKIVGGLDWLRLPLPGRTVHSRGGLLDQGSIARDGAGRAVLMASSNTDVMFLQGYFHASERLFQMEISRRVASGTLAELLGENALTMDMYMRRFYLYQLGTEDEERLSLSERAMVEQYVAGVNLFISEGHAASLELSLLGLWHASGVTTIRPWRVVDSLALARLQTLQYAHGWEQTLLRDFIRASGGSPQAIEEALRVVSSSMGGGEGRAKGGTGVGKLLSLLTEQDGAVTVGEALGGSVVALASSAKHVCKTGDASQCKGSVEGGGDESAVIGATIHAGTGTGATWIQNHLLVEAACETEPDESAAAAATCSETTGDPPLDVTGLSVPGIPLVFSGATPTVSFVGLPSATVTEQLRTGIAPAPRRPPTDPSRPTRVDGGTDGRGDGNNGGDGTSDKDVMTNEEDTDSANAHEDVEVFWVADPNSDDKRPDGRTGYHRHTVPRSASRSDHTMGNRQDGDEGSIYMGDILKWPVSSTLCSSFGSSCANISRAFGASMKGSTLVTPAVRRDTAATTLRLLMGLNTAVSAVDAMEAVKACSSGKCGAVMSITVADSKGDVATIDTAPHSADSKPRRLGAGKGGGIAVTDRHSRARLSSLVTGLTDSRPTPSDDELLVNAAQAGESLSRVRAVLSDTHSAGGAATARIVALADEQLHGISGACMDAKEGRDLLRSTLSATRVRSIALKEACLAMGEAAQALKDASFNGTYARGRWEPTLVELVRAQLTRLTVAAAAARSDCGEVPQTVLPHHHTRGAGLNFYLSFMAKTSPDPSWAFGGLLHGFEAVLMDDSSSSSTSFTSSPVKKSFWVNEATSHVKDLLEKSIRKNTMWKDGGSSSASSIESVDAVKWNPSDMAAMLVGAAVVSAWRDMRHIITGDESYANAISAHSLEGEKFVRDALSGQHPAWGDAATTAGQRQPYLSPAAHRPGYVHALLATYYPSAETSVEDWPVGAPDAVARTMPGAAGAWTKSSPLSANPLAGTGPAAVRLELRGGYRACMETTAARSEDTCSLRMWLGQAGTPGGVGGTEPLLDREVGSVPDRSRTASTLIMLTK